MNYWSKLQIRPKTELIFSRLMELVELMSSPSKKVSSDELQGRSSGSLAWRLARGEQGQTSNEPGKGHAWRVTEAEKEALTFHLVNFASLFNLEVT